MTPRYPRSVAPGASGTDARAKPKRQRRPSPMLTPDRIRTICKKIEQGVPQTAAAGALGIPKRTLDNWLAAGRAPSGEGTIYQKFADAVDEARAKFHESRAVAVVAHAAEDPRIALEILKRRFPEDWADPDRGAVNVNVGVLVESPEWKALSSRLLEVLAPFPEALAAVALELAGGQAETAEVVEVEATELPELMP